MSLFRKRSAGASELIWQGLPQRGSRRQGSVDVTTESALAHSAVWAAVRLRADLMSTMPIDAFRRIASEGVDVEVTKPAVLITPSSHGDGQPMDMSEWMYSTQVDLDKSGNTFGGIGAWDGQGLPAQIDPLPAEKVTVSVRKGKIDHYKIGRDKYLPREIWHERQYTTPGVHVGLSPVAYAAQSIGGYLSAQQFALDWFSNGAVPGAILKNTAKKLDKGESSIAKRQFMSSVSIGEPFVTGMDWDYQMLQAKAAESQFLEEMQYSISDIARFFGVPADMLDAPSQGSSITYANVTQRNLQLLIMNIGPAVNRRERALARLLPAPRHVKLNSDALLRMDPQTRQTVIDSRIKARTLTPDEGRALDNLPPLTIDQYEQFNKLFPPKANSTQEPIPEGTPQ